MYPEAKSVGRWLRHGWHVAVAYVVGFLVFMALVGWHPTDKRGKSLTEGETLHERCCATTQIPA
jgi:hypothetical protein